MAYCANDGTRGTNEYRIFGSPGTGKTATLSAQIHADAEVYGEEAILACALTKTAAVVLSGRNLTIGQCGTFHSVGYQLLGCPPVADDKKNITEWNAEYPYYALSGGLTEIDDGGETERTDTQPGDAVYNDYQIRRAKMIERTKWPDRILYFAKQWEAWKQRKGFIDFGDMIEIPYRERIGPPEGIEVAFLDEAQDMDLLSLSLFRQWGEQLQHIVLAGDDDQAIFSFRGSEPEAFLDRPLPADHINIRPQSYRLPRAIHAFATRWVDQLRMRQPKVYKPRDADGEIAYNNTDRFYPEGILREIDETLSANKTCMVLTSCGYMLKPLKVVLKNAGIPFHNPWRTKRGDWNPLGFTGKGVSARERLLAYLSTDPTRTGQTTRLLWSLNEMRQWTAAVKTDGIFKRGVRAMLEKLDGDREVSFAELTSWFLPDVLDDALSLSLDWFSSVLLPSKRRVYQYLIAVAEKQGARALIEEPKLIVGTIHSVKGGEASTVILYPDLPPSAADRWVSHDRDAIIRQFYVGITRAKDKLVLCAPSSDAAVSGLS